MSETSTPVGSLARSPIAEEDFVVVEPVPPRPADINVEESFPVAMRPGAYTEPVAAQDFAPVVLAEVDYFAVLQRALDALNAPAYDGWAATNTTTGWPVSTWRKLEGGQAKNGLQLLATDLREAQEKLPRDTQAMMGVLDALQIICEVGITPCPETLPVEPTPEGWVPMESGAQVVDLNTLYRDKCTGDAPPWAGSVLCELGAGKAIGRFIASVRFVQNTGWYSEYSVVRAVLENLAYVRSMLETLRPTVPYLGPLGRLITQFYDLDNDLQRRLQTGRAIGLGDLDPIMVVLENILKYTPGIRRGMRHYLNVDVLG